MLFSNADTQSRHHELAVRHRLSTGLIWTQEFASKSRMDRLRGIVSELEMIIGQQPPSD